MAIVTGGPDFAIDMAAAIIPSVFDYQHRTLIQNQNGNELRFFSDNGDFTSFRGNLVLNAQGQVTGGTLTALDVDDHSVGIQIHLANLTTPAKTLIDLVLAGKFDEAKALVMVNSDQITGTGLKDNLNGFEGADTINAGAGNDVVIGGGGNDFLIGGSGVDFLNGGLDADRLAGQTGNDKLRGNAGLDSMTGGAGVDQFIFDSPAGATNYDKIFDFQAGVDKIVLDDQFFAGIGASFHNGVLDTGAFRVIGQAGGPEDRILYNADNGKLYFDEDGSNTLHAAVLFAQVGLHLPVGAGDFLMI